MFTLGPATFTTATPTALAPAQVLGDGLLGWAITFFVLAVVAAVAGFRGVAGLTMGIAKILVVAFLVLAVLSLLL